MSLHPAIRLSAAFVIALVAAGAIAFLLARPAAIARAETATILIYPGCGASLQACINAAGPGSTIVITPGNYFEPAMITLTKAVSLTGANSNTVVFHAPANSRVMQVNALSPISVSTIISGITFVGGSLAGTSCPASCGGALIVSGGARPSIQNVIISGSTAYKGGGLYVNTGLTLTLRNISVLNNIVARDGGGINADNNSPLIILAGRIENNRSTAIFPAGGYGGGILSDAPLVLIHVDVYSNSVTGPGGGVYASADVFAEDGTFADNHAGDQGGGIRAAGNTLLYQVHFISNTASAGGALHTSGYVDEQDGIFWQNRSTGSGGAVWAGGDFSSIVSHYQDNQAGDGGGAVYARGAGYALSSTFRANHAANIGGGLLLSGSLYVNATGFYSNTGANGGAAYITGSVSLVASDWISNSASLSGCSCGGALFGGGPVDIQGGTFDRNSGGQSSALFASASLTMTGVTVTNNYNGIDGAVSMNFGQAHVSGGTFFNNTAWVGGGLYFSNGSGEVRGTQFISNAALFDGGALFAYTPLTIANALFMSNTVANGGGGALRAENWLSISSTGFLSNSATTGGAIHQGNVYPANARIVNSLFAQNRAQVGSAGADVYLHSTQNAVLLHNTLADVTPNPNAAVAVLSGTLLVTDTIFYSHAIGISLTGAIVSQDYNLFFGVPTPEFISSGSSGGGAHDIFAIPRFVNVPARDFHLGAGSAAIDAGTNGGVTRDFDGDLRPVGAGFDIGFDERLLRLYLPLSVR